MRNKVLNLPTVTLVCVDAINKETPYLLSKIQDRISFGDFLYIDSGINSVQEYNSFMLNDLNSFIKTEHCLVVQLDGFPLNNDAWTDEFLNYDYIGAPWINFPEMPAKELVGNGGFSLRSKKLLDEIAKLKSSGSCLEDNFICIEQRKYLESLGIKFAPTELAKQFSIENGIYKGQFGFHGKLTMKINKQLGIFK